MLVLAQKRWFLLSGLSFSHSVALNDRSETPKSKATIDGLHTAARLLKTWSNARAAPTAARCVCTGVGHGTHLGTNNNKYEKAPCIDLTVTAQWRALVGRATDMTLAPGSAMRRRSPRACSLLESGGWLLATSIGWPLRIVACLFVSSRPAFLASRLLALFLPVG